MAIAILALQVANEFLHIVHVVVQMELAIGQWHQAGVFPVGDIDLVPFEHGAHGVAQQRGVVAGQRRHNKNHWLRLELGQRGGIIRKALETAQFAKRLVDFDALVDRHTDAVDIHGVNAKRWLFIVFAQPVHQVIPSSNALRHRRLAQGRHGVAEQLGSGLRKVGERLHERALSFVDVVQHGGKNPFCCSAI